MVPKQTIGCFHESIGCFGLTTSQPSKSVFNLHLSYKTIGCFDKTTGFFSLSLKKTFQLKGLRILMLWIQPRVEIYNLSTPDSI